MFILKQACLFIAGKVIVYSLIGASVILLGVKVESFNRSIPWIVSLQKILGPLMIVIGIYLAGWMPIRFSFGFRTREALLKRLKLKQGSVGPLTLGAVYSVAFCPTLFILFFGGVMPLALTSKVRILFPGIFAIGTAIPVLLAAFLASNSKRLQFQNDSVSVTSPFIGAKHARFRVITQKISAIVFILAGINDVLWYWTS